MKRTLALFFAGFAILVAALNVPAPGELVYVHEKVDFSGIEEVRIDGSAFVEFSTANPGYRWQRRANGPATGPGVAMRRDGNILHFEPLVAGWPTITVPPRITRVAFDAGSVEAKSLVPALTVTSPAFHEISGRYRALTIVAPGESECEPDDSDYCHPDIAIEATISRLRVHTQNQYVKVEYPDRVRSARFHFGERARLTLSYMDAMPDVTIVRDGGDIVDESAAPAEEGPTPQGATTPAESGA